MRIHVAPVFAPARIQEKIPVELFMYWFRARGPGWGGGLPTGWPGASRPSKVYVLCAEPKEHKHFRPGTRPGGSGTRQGGSVTGMTEKLFMCQMFMCLFQPLGPAVLEL